MPKRPHDTANITETPSPKFILLSPSCGSWVILGWYSKYVTTTTSTQELNSDQWAEAQRTLLSYFFHFLIVGKEGGWGRPRGTLKALWKLCTALTSGLDALWAWLRVGPELLKAFHFTAEEYQMSLSLSKVSNILLCQTWRLKKSFILQVERLWLKVKELPLMQFSKISSILTTAFKS